MRSDDRHDTNGEPVTLFVEYEGADDLVADYTENLSSGTTFVVTDRALPIGTKVQLVLSFPGLLQTISIEGTVQSTQDSRPTEIVAQLARSGAGIQFTAGTARDQLAQMIAKIQSRDPETVSRPYHVLVVEDNRHVAMLLQDGLRSSTRRDFARGLAFVVRQAEDGRAAVDLLRSETFDALIIDVYLPIMDGARVIRVVRGELGLVDLPIIAVSAGGDAARRSALEAGANRFLDKPMRLRQVIETIRELIA